MFFGDGWDNLNLDLIVNGRSLGNSQNVQSMYSIIEKSNALCNCHLKEIKWHGIYCVMCACVYCNAPVCRWSSIIKGCTRDLARNELEFTITAGVCAHTFIHSSVVEGYHSDYHTNAWIWFRISMLHRIWDAHVHQNMYVCHILNYIFNFSHTLKTSVGKVHCALYTSIHFVEADTPLL